MMVTAKVRGTGRPLPFSLDADTSVDIPMDKGATLILNHGDALTHGTAWGLPYTLPETLSCCQRPQGAVVRTATDADLERLDELAQREREAARFCQERADNLGLLMRVRAVEGTLSGANLVCYFTADARVDFRQLVRDLGRELHAHVRMHQVSPREMAGRTCGMGTCGQRLCCTTFLAHPINVTAQDARRVAPQIPHAKLAGACGKLMCCLTFDDGAPPPQAT